MLGWIEPACQKRVMWSPERAMHKTLGEPARDERGGWWKGVGVCLSCTSL